MHMAKSLIAAALLAAALVGAVVVPAALTRGTFAFDAWPKAPGSRASDEQVAIAEPPRARQAARHERPDAAPKVVVGAPSAPVAGTPAAAQEVAQVSTPASTPRSSDPQPQAPAPDPAPDQVPAPTVPSTPDDDEVAESDPSEGDSAQVEARPVASETPAAATAPAPDEEDSSESSEDDSDADTPAEGIAPPPGWVHRTWRHQPGRGHNDGKN
jgi:hypothetical protein